MKLIRHTVSSPTSSMSIVCLGNSGIAHNLRAVFQSPGSPRHKVAFACSESELKHFLRVLTNGLTSEAALVRLFRNRGFMEAISLGSGSVKIRYEIDDSCSRAGTKGVVFGHYKLKPIEDKTE